MTPVIFQENACVDSTSRCEEEELFSGTNEKILLVLPKLPEHFGIDYSISSCISNKTSIDLLTEEKHFGILICFSEQENVEKGINFRPACVYIPEPMFDKMVFMKIIKLQNSNVNLEQNLYESISSQLMLFDANFENNIREKIPVCVLLVCVVNNLTETSTHGNLFDSLSEKITSFASENIGKLTVEVEKVFKKRKNSGIGFSGEKKRFREIVSKRTSLTNLTNNDHLKNFVEKFNKHLPIVISTKIFKHPGGGEMSLKDFSKVICLYKFYFPATETKLDTLPHFLRIRDNLLDKTDNSGNLVENYEGYLGEVNYFWVNFVSKIPDPAGLLIKAYNDKNINSILTQTVFNSNFDIDWLFCGHKMILAFEIGRTNNPLCPISSITNKFEQVLGKLMPTMFIVLTSLYKSVQTCFLSTYFNDETFWQFVKRRFKFVIYWPNISGEVFVQLFRDLKEAENSTGFKKHLKQLIQNSKPAMLQNLLILLHEDPKMPEIGTKTFNLDSNLEITEFETQVSEIMQCKIEQENVENSIMSYISALLAFSCLIEKDLLSAPDNQLLTTPNTSMTNNSGPTFFEKVSNKGPLNARLNFLDVILSPQQHRILAENRRRVLISGEPGSGKSALLFARAKQAARDDNIDHVIFSIPAGKSEFKIFVDCFINQPGNELLKQKFRFISFEDLANPDIFGKDW